MIILSLRTTSHYAEGSAGALGADFSMRRDAQTVLPLPAIPLASSTYSVYRPPLSDLNPIDHNSPRLSEFLLCSLEEEE